MTGQDSLVISRTRIIRKKSLISSAITNLGDLEALPADELTDVDEQAWFRAAMDRDADEDKYVCQRKLATGGMGAVYYVFDRDFHRQSAMKVILPRLKQTAAALRSFVREARITGQLEHPNIIPVHDLGFLPEHGVFFTMKMMQGEPLVDVLHKLEIGDAETVHKYDVYSLLNIFRKICDAVAFAHSRQIIHRDIKPHNIMVGDYGEVLLMDWGLAKRLHQPDDLLDLPAVPSSIGTESTEIGVVKGSPAYMSPEQARGDRDLDVRSDVFLLGATLYHLFTFFPPYLGDDVYDIVRQAQRCDYLPPREMESGNLRLPGELCDIIARAMAAERADRYQSVAELIADLDTLMKGEMSYGQRRFRAGEYLLAEGELGTECFVIVSGRVRVQKAGRDQTFVLGQLSEGDIVGEMALITHEPRSASVVALTETEVVVLTQDVFNRNLNRLPPWMTKAIVALAQRLSEANAKSLKRQQQ